MHRREHNSLLCLTTADIDYDLQIVSTLYEVLMESTVKRAMKFVDVDVGEDPISVSGTGQDLSRELDAAVASIVVPNELNFRKK